MAPQDRQHRKPAISMSQTDHARLSRLAESLTPRKPALANELFAELDRARIVPDARLRPDVVRMGSSLRFTTDTG